MNEVISYFLVDYIIWKDILIPIINIVSSLLLSTIAIVISIITLKNQSKMQRQDIAFLLHERRSEYLTYLTNLNEGFKKLWDCADTQNITDGYTILIKKIYEKDSLFIIYFEEFEKDVTAFNNTIKNKQGLFPKEFRDFCMIYHECISSTYMILRMMLNLSNNKKEKVDLSNFLNSNISQDYQKKLQYVVEIGFADKEDSIFLNLVNDIYDKFLAYENIVKIKAFKK